MYLTKKIQKRLDEVARTAHPHEAAGIIVNESQVVELPNHAGNPENSFELHKTDIVEALGHLSCVEDTIGIVIWHSHPNGGVGPSREDLRHKVIGIPHLVVTLAEDDAIFTWY